MQEVQQKMLICYGIEIFFVACRPVRLVVQVEKNRSVLHHVMQDA